MRVRLLTFDIFGTVIDWQEGLSRAVQAAGCPFSPGDLDRVIDLQAADEVRGPFRSYRAITAASLVTAFAMAPAAADEIGATVGRWPLFPDAREGLRRLMALAPCVAMTNSDRVHGEQVQAQLGYHLSGWICAEDIGCYKPAPACWHETARRCGVPLGPAWWHVSAYADYDLDTARELGLTCVFVSRPHCRPGPAHHTVPDLLALADLLMADP